MMTKRTKNKVDALDILRFIARHNTVLRPELMDKFMYERIVDTRLTTLCELELIQRDRWKGRSPAHLQTIQYTITHLGYMLLTKGV